MVFALVESNSWRWSATAVRWAIVGIANAEAFASCARHPEQSALLVSAETCVVANFDHDKARARGQCKCDNERVCWIWGGLLMLVYALRRYSVDRHRRDGGSSACLVLPRCSAPWAICAVVREASRS
eukprot:UN2099